MPQRPAPYPPAQPQSPYPARNDELLRAIATAAGLQPDIFAGRDPRDVAYEIGAVLRTTVDELAMLLKARAAAKAGRDFAEADRIRKALLDQGIELKDSATGTTWVRSSKVGEQA